MEKTFATFLLIHSAFNNTFLHQKSAFARSVDGGNSTKLVSCLLSLGRSAHMGLRCANGDYCGPEWEGVLN